MDEVRKNWWKLAAWSGRSDEGPPDPPEPDRVDGVAEGEMEDVELADFPGLIFTIRYRIPYDYQFEDDHYEEEISWGAPQVLGAQFVPAENPQAEPKSVGGKILEAVAGHIDDSFSDWFEEDIRSDVEDNHSRRGRWEDED
jgi:hypothetical protein